MNERPEIYKKDVAPSLWRMYERTPEYKEGRIESINSVHPLIYAAEQQGLIKVVHKFIAELENTSNLRVYFQGRQETDWLNEWKQMHEVLFRTVYRAKGVFRTTGQDVRFGDPGDEELHRVPPGGPQTLTDIYGVANLIKLQLYYVDSHNTDSVCQFLAQVHYNFIRVHPFLDGNGRIARAVTDQLAISLGYPPIIAGFPRTNEEKKNTYHSAITGCIGDPSCYKLAVWIKNQIEVKISELA